MKRGICQLGGFLLATTFYIVGPFNRFEMKTYQFNFKSKGCLGIVTSLVITMAMLIFFGFNLDSFLFHLSDIKQVTLALKKDNGVFLMPINENKYLLERKLANDEVPAIYPSFEIIVDDGELFVEPENLKKILGLISGDYFLFPNQESSFDGYVVDSGHNVFEYSNLVENTGEIGNQIQRGVITIWDTSLNKSMEVSWKDFPDITPEKNCISKSIWVSTMPYPGKVVYSSRHVIVIKLQDILDFYNNNVRLQYDEDHALLFVIHKSN